MQCAREAQGSLLGYCCVVDTWRWVLSCGVVFSGGLFLLDSGGFSETQEEQLRFSRGNWSDLEFARTC